MSSEYFVEFSDLKSATTEIRDELNAAISSVLDHSKYSSGPDITKFENEFANWIGTKYCVGAASGTAAIEMALFACGIGKDDIVVTQSNTFAATAMAIHNVNADTVFVDCDIRGQMNVLEACEMCITSGAKAIVVVHMYGSCTNMDILCSFAKEHGIVLIEDCAQAHGTTWKGQKVGTFGHAGCFSFYPGKNLGACGDAGAVVTNYGSIAKAAKMYGNVGMETKYVHRAVGINSRLDTMQAAILSVKLRHLYRWNDKRRIVAELYTQKLRKYCPLLKIMHPFVSMYDTDTDIFSDDDSMHVLHTYHLFVVVFENKTQRDVAKKMLLDNKVECFIQYPTPCHKMEAFPRHNKEYHPISEQLSETMISLPMHPYVTESHVDYIVQILSTL